MKIESYRIIDVTDDIRHGDMPGDVVNIGDDHIAKASTIFPYLVEELNNLEKDKAVISIFGGSGVGKSEIASVLGHYLEGNGIKNYILSGDNYPYRIPMYNDAERMSIFRAEGLKGLIDKDIYDDEVKEKLLMLWREEADSDPKKIDEYPFLKTYQEYGRAALKQYLGTSKEQDYVQINDIIAKFKNGDDSIYLKRMGRSEDERYYEKVDFSNIDVLIIEWTHGGNANIEGIDIPILLNSTPEETREHRRNRARDGKTDSAFTTMVLEIEQEELDERRKDAKIVISKKGEILDR